MPSSTASHGTRATAPATESESGTEESSDIRSDGDYEGELPSQSETRPSNVVVQVVELQPGTITSEQDTVPATSSDQQPQEPLNQTQDQDQDQALPCRWITNGSLCNLVFAEGSHLYDHIVDDHVGRRASKFQQPSALLDCMWQGCPHGTRPFVKRDNLVSHCRMHVPTKPYECQTCGRTFKWPHDLKKHCLRKGHPYVEEKKPNPNPSVVNRELHIKPVLAKVQSPTEIPPQQNSSQSCLWPSTVDANFPCLKSFTEADSFMDHLINEHQTESFNCLWRGCPVKLEFLSKDDLLTHCKSHITFQPHHVCSICRVAFRWPQDLQKHILRLKHFTKAPERDTKLETDLSAGPSTTNIRSHPAPEPPTLQSSLKLETSGGLESASSSQMLPSMASFPKNQSPQSRKSVLNQNHPTIQYPHSHYSPPRPAQPYNSQPTPPQYAQRPLAPPPHKHLSSHPVPQYPSPHHPTQQHSTYTSHYPSPQQYPQHTASHIPVHGQPLTPYQRSPMQHVYSPDHSQYSPQHLNHHRPHYEPYPLPQRPQPRGYVDDGYAHYPPRSPHSIQYAPRPHEYPPGQYPPRPYDFPPGPPPQPYTAPPRSSYPYPPYQPPPQEYYPHGPPPPPQLSAHYAPHHHTTPMSSPMPRLGEQNPHPNYPPQQQMGPPPQHRPLHQGFRSPNEHFASPRHHPYARPVDAHQIPPHPYHPEHLAPDLNGETVGAERPGMSVNNLLL